MRGTAIYSLVMVLFAVVAGLCQVTTTKQMESPGFPRVVARTILKDKTGDLKPITLFTPKHFGVYRISGVMVVTAQNGNDWYGSITYEDGGGSQQFSFDASGNKGDYAVGPFVCRDFKGTPIRLSLSTGGDQGGTYNLFVVVEQIM
jgi:hypothetical protein